MKSYSLDLRQKIIEIHEQGETSQRKLAKRFNVSLSTIQRLIKLKRNGESLESKRRGGGQEKKLDEAQMKILGELIEADNDATLVELCDQVALKTGVRVSRSTMGRLVQQLGFTRKKKRSTPVKGKQSESKSSEQNTGKNLVRLKSLI
jgi:putative transposase